VEQEQLTKKERKLLKKQERDEQSAKEKRKHMVIKWGGIALGIALLFGFGFWIVKESSKPLPGESLPDLGRDHVPQTEWSKFAYNSNPPTSGPHDVVWTKPGIYDTPQGEGNLVHSLEHGYIIISYNCEKKLQAIGPDLRFTIYDLRMPKVYAHEEGDTLTLEEHAAKASMSASLEGDVWKSKACEDLKKELSDFAKEQKLWKLIVVARPQLDVPIALTAWTRIQKMEKIDKDTIRRFIDSYRDQGPEKTME